MVSRTIVHTSPTTRSRGGRGERDSASAAIAQADATAAVARTSAEGFAAFARARPTSIRKASSAAWPSWTSRMTRVTGSAKTAYESGCA